MFLTYVSISTPLPAIINYSIKLQGNGALSLWHAILPLLIIFAKLSRTVFQLWNACFCDNASWKTQSHPWSVLLGAMIDTSSKIAPVVILYGRVSSLPCTASWMAAWMPEQMVLFWKCWCQYDRDRHTVSVFYVVWIRIDDQVIQVSDSFSCEIDVLFPQIVNNFVIWIRLDTISF